VGGSWLHALRLPALVAGIAAAGLSACGGSSAAGPAPPAPHPLPLLHVVMRSSRTGWAWSPAHSMGSAAVYRTTSGGTVWDPVLNVLRPGWIDAAGFWGRQDAWVAVGRPNAAQDVLWYTGDGGKNWTVLGRSLPAGAYSFSWISPQEGWVLIGGPLAGPFEPVQVWHTVDGGRHWTRLTQTTSSSYGPGLLPLGGIKGAVVFRSPRVGWIVGQSWSGRNVLCYRTTDGGRTWFAQSLPLPPPRSRPLAGISTTTAPVWARGSDGFVTVVFERAAQANQGAQAVTLLETTRGGGARWRLAHVFFGVAEISAPNAHTVIALIHVGARWVRQASADGGRTWSRPIPTSLHHVAGFQMTGTKRGWVEEVVRAGTLLTTTPDAGRTWTTLAAVVRPAGTAVQVPPL
jgi:photosystem II stability/assembly factor-like uncharacterized protein